MISLKDVKIVIKNGHPKVWGRILDLLVNKDRFVLGYNSQNVKRLMPKVMEEQVPPLSEIFVSVGDLIDGQTCVVEEQGVSISMEEELVYKKVE